MAQITKTIILKDVELNLFIGVHDFERGDRQRLLVSVSVSVAEQEEKDDIENTLDYDQIYKFLKSLEDSEHFDLQETVCRKILKFVLAMDGVRNVEVTTKKPDIFDDTGYVGINMNAQS